MIEDQYKTYLLNVQVTPLHRCQDSGGHDLNDLLNLKWVITNYSVEEDKRGDHDKKKL